VYLAAHLGEPIGNYGVGSYGVYQAYRRMVREEKTDHGAEYLIFYIWGDDPTRSLMRCRFCSIYRWFENDDGRRFHADFWAHVELDLNTGRFVERENPLSTRESLYRMTDPSWMVEHLRDDLALQLSAYADGHIKELDHKRVTKLAYWLDFPFDWSLESKKAELADAYPGAPPITPMQAPAAALLNRYSQRATIFVLEKVRAFVSHENKRLLILLFDPFATLQQMHKGEPRNDQETVDYLVRNKVDYFDMNEAHLRDFKKYSLSWWDYMKEYFIGHYNPHGNHFFAFSIKDKLVAWLDPRPITYRNPDAETLDFESYIHGYGRDR
jgi:hypothetical protein